MAAGSWKRRWIAAYLSVLVIRRSSLINGNTRAYRSIGQLVQRRLVDLPDLVPGPGGARGRGRRGVLEGNGDATGQRAGTGRGLHGAIGPGEPGHHEAGSHCPENCRE